MDLELRPWADDDLPLLYRTVGDATMMAHLGGPENEAQILRRHQLLLDITPAGEGAAFTIRLERDGPAAGSIGFWDSEWQGEPIYETGWMVLPEFAGRGVASAAARLIVERARAAGKYRYLHAFPGAANGPSNGVCRNAGFEHRGACEVEYPKGTMMQAVNWRVDLHPERDEPR